jgi:plastocyanin/peptidoglycan hydrolase-like protein with peptidoglycan-binding domain
MRFSGLFAILCGLVFLVVVPFSARASTTTVNITTANQFSPSSITINPGDTVTWSNLDSRAHTATADNVAFDSGPIQPGQTFSATFNQSGTFVYHDSYYGATGGVGMSGTIIVNSAGVASSGTYVNPNSAYYPTGSASTYQTSSSNSTTAQLYAQVQTLLAEINALKGGGTVSTGTGTSYSGSGAACFSFGRTLSYGATGADVTQLQQFLAKDATVYPEGTVSGYFGSLTQAAVQRWQTKHGIVSSGTPTTTGFGVVGSQTAAAMTASCGGTTGSYYSSSGSTSSGSTPTVGGFIQVTPINGSAPLTVNVTATVNTGGACGGATYVLDFGDGTASQQIPTAAGNCNQQSQTYQHSYIYGGTYSVTLTAGSHTTQQSVTVSGPAAPNVTTNYSSSSARGTISTSVTSGTAPLTVTFYVSCASGTAYNVVFGDGTDLGSSAVSGTKCGAGALDAVSHTFTKTGSYQVQLQIFIQQTNGTVLPVNVSSVSVGVASVADSYSYNPPQLTSSASTALTFGLQFDLPTPCTGFDITWGDGSADTVQSDGGTAACSQTTATVTRSHTYPTQTTGTSKSYVITLKRGATLSRTESLNVTVTQ